MVKLVVSSFKTARPNQWIKNLVVFAALVFTGELFNQDLFWLVSRGFLALSLLVSSVYFINDIADVKADQLHPFKRERPIAKGELAPSTAFFLAIVGIAASLYIASTLSSFFFLALLAYLLLQIAYTFWLKAVPIFDILSIATGFILRIYAGAFLIDAHLSVWFLLCVISVSLFLASGKRRAELAVITERMEVRRTLKFYSTHLLDSYLAMFATAAWLSWALFTFFTEQERAFYVSRAIPPSWLDNLPLTILGSGKLLMLSIPIVIFGVMRYLHIVYEGSRAEVPEKVLLTDRPLLATVSLWLLIILLVIYVVSPRS